MRNTSLSRLFAQAAAQNQYSRQMVSDTSEQRYFRQEEVPHRHIPMVIRSRISQALERSDDGWLNTSVEVGFYALEKGRKILTTELITSNKSDFIFDKDMHPVLERFLQDCASLPGDYVRAQFYHTHPRGPSARELSRADIDSSLEDLEILRRTGIKVPFDIHALPYDLSYATEVITHYIPPPVGSKERTRPVTVQMDPVALRATIE